MNSVDLPLVIEPAMLLDRLADGKLIVLDLRPPERFAAGHVPGALSASYADFVAARPPAMGLLPDLHKLSEVLSELGVREDTPVVGYDDEGGGRASRVIWTLHALGHQAASLLNGGFQAWVAGGHPLQQAEVPPLPSSFEAQLANPTVLATKDYIRLRLGDPDLVLLDTRSDGEYRGMDLRAARGGHIPGAVNRNWTDNIDPSRDLRLLPDEPLAAAMRAMGVTPNREIVVYCQTHHRSAHTYVALKHLGYPRVRGYAGAWSEWGNDPETPIET
jgi:thiosulfate/3-mercaptopyruvate sulfurtransferase